MAAAKSIPYNSSFAEIPSLSMDSFDALVLNGEGPICVEFMSYGCQFCRAMEPVLDEVAERLTTQVRIYKVNVAANQGLADRFEISATPTLVMFENGENLGQLDGPKADVISLQAAITNVFKSQP